MKEKIAEFLYWLANRGRSDIYRWQELPAEGKEIWYGDVERILREICEEIEKVENPQPHDSKYREIQCEYIGFELCRQKILSLFRKGG